ncbi:hypothetical protein PENSPDRAFT_352777 [Peniophora sp. CONT]|nr:hypothetical protein PENSPDRAFT_352777 [Peniophora sp. CONT]
MSSGALGLYDVRLVHMIAGEGRYMRHCALISEDFAIQWASIALLYYDYALTFPQEVKYIWRGSKKSLLVVLYVSCRYALLANVLYLLAIANKLGGPSSCDAAYKVLGVVSVLGRAAVIFTFLARAYVVCARNKFVLAGLGAIAVTCVVLDIIHVPGLRCKGSSTIQIANTLLSILVCVFEALATLSTLFRSVQALRFGGSPISARRHTFNYLVAEQGILYFALVSAFTIGATVLNFRAPGGFFQRLLNAITLPLSGLITARFILRLRAYHGRGTSDDSAQATPPVSTFEVATHDNRQNSRTIFDEFGVDPLQVASRKSDDEKGEYAAHGLRFAINRGERPGWEADIDQTATYVGSEYRSMSSGRDRHETAPRSLDCRQGEFQEGCSGRQTGEFVEGCSGSRA